MGLCWVANLGVYCWNCWAQGWWPSPAPDPVVTASDGPPCSSSMSVLDLMLYWSNGWMWKAYGRCLNGGCTWSCIRNKAKQMLGPVIEPRSLCFPPTRSSTGPTCLVVNVMKIKHNILKQSELVGKKKTRAKFKWPNGITPHIFFFLEPSY